MACYLKSYTYSFFSGSVCRGPRGSFLFPFKQIFKFFWVFPLSLPIQKLNYVPVVRAAMCQTLSCSHKASLPPSHSQVGRVTSPEQISGAACPLSETRDCLLKNARPQSAEIQTMNGLQIMSLRSYSDHLSEPHRQRCEGFRDVGQCWSMNKWLLHSLHQIKLLPHKSLLSPSLRLPYFHTVSFLTLAWTTSPRQKCTQ